MSEREPAQEAEWESGRGFGLPPLRQAVEFAGAARSLTEAVLSLDRPSGRLEALIGEIRAADRELRAAAAVTALPRVGERAGDAGSRPYLDHGVHAGAYNPVFPEYDMIALGESLAAGSVCFPVAYEGPPGCVHGGFLAVFFDAVIAHHNSEAGAAGKTKRMEIRYRRPVPLRVTLEFEIERRVEGREIVSAASLYRRPELAAAALSRAIAGRRDALPPVGTRI